MLLFCIGILIDIIGFACERDIWISASANNWKFV